MARKILLADDSVTAQNMGRKILTDAGYEVTTVNNGSAALKKIAEHKPDLIVLDVYMPGYSGLEVCQRIKENRETSRIPVLLTVGKLEPFKPEEARRARADAFVVKPFEASELLTALTKLEDKIVPQAEPYKQGRFAKAMAAVDSDAETGEKFGDTDGGWKNRLRFPGTACKSRDPEPDVDYAATQGKGVRELDIDGKDKKAKAKSIASEDKFERPVPAGLPPDITPEEIAAITAAAAQVSGMAPPPLDTPQPPTKSDAPPEAAEPDGEEPAPATFASSPTLDQELSEAETPATVEVSPPADIPIAIAESSSAAESLNPQAVAMEAIADPTMEVPQTDVAESAPSEAALAETEEPEETFPVVQDSYEPAPTVPVQADDVQPQAVEPVSQAVASEAPAIPEVISSGPLSADAAHADEAAASDPQPAPPVPAPAAVVEDEFMTALQSLMPAKSSESSAASNTKEQDLPPALAAIVAEVDSRVLVAHTTGPRWIAEEVALIASEATLSLQKEMEQAYAAFAAADGFRVATASVTIGDARVAALAITEISNQSSEAVAMAEVAAAPVVLAMAAAAADSGGAVGAPSTTEDASHSYCEPVAEEIQQEIRAADAASPESGMYAPELTVQDLVPEMVSAEAAPALSQTETVGGIEDMAANWKNIRDSIAGAATKPVAKEEGREIEVPHFEPETVAAAPESSHASAADPRAIANIVDSVLAELRPKIVEEIAKKLSDPKKS